MNIEKNGFDSPKSSREDDKLGRWDFAKELYNLLITARNNWSVRVGIYGSWGEGKTTVLNFIYEIAKKENQAIIRFNPWEYQSAAELWESFTDKLYKTLKEFDDDIKLSNKFRFLFGINIKKWFRKPISLVEPLAKITPYSEYGIPILKSFLSFNVKSIKRIPELVKDKRVIVLIDDLERANPVLISQVLFTVKELLDLPGFSFAISFDPEIVNSSMRQHNIRYGEDKDFIEKIVDFPRWMPKPNEDELKDLIKFEITKDINFIPYDAFEKIFHHLPKNPRKLKQFIRSFLGFKEELIRYETEEINWVTLLLINLLKVNFPSVADSIVKNQKIWDGITTDKWFGERDHEQDKVKEYEEEVKSICFKYGINDSQTAILELIKEIADSNFPLTVSALDSYTYLTERRNILTWKEFNSLLLDFEKQPNKEILEKHLNNLIKNTSYSSENILSTLFYIAIEYRNWALGMASDSILESEVISHTNDANLGLEIIRKICFEFEGFVGSTKFLTTEHFSALYQTITKWLHFTMPSIYRESRELEKNLLIDLCKEMSIDLIEIMKFLKPWMPFRHIGRNEKFEKELANELGLILEERIARQLLEKFLLEKWIYNIFLRDQHVVEHYILLRNTSYFWTSDLKQKFIQLIDGNKEDDKFIKNTYHFLSLLESTFIDPAGRWSVIDDEKAIITDDELMIKIWEVALHKKINPRIFKSVEGFKDKLKQKTKLELPKPEWWDEIKEMVEKRNAEES